MSANTKKKKTKEEFDDTLDQEAKEEPKTDDYTDDKIAGMTKEQLKNELITRLVKKAKEKKNVLTYSDMADFLDSYDLDKNAIDEIYESLLSKDIEVTSESEPEEFGMIMDHDEDRKSVV